MSGRALLAALLLLAPARAQWLHDPVTLPTGDHPLRLAAGDLDGDGRGDLVVLDSPPILPSASFTVMLGEAGGTLGPATTFPIIDDTSDVAVGDMTGDGNADLVTVNSLFLEAAIYPGTGGGTVSAPSVWPVGKRATFLALSDLEIDGDLDVVTANVDSPNSVSVLEGDGLGALSSAVTYTIGNTPQTLTVVPLDADALPDVLVSTLIGEYFYEGTGGGALAAPVLACTLSARDHALADLDNDGDLDLVLGREGATALADTALGDGAGLFTPEDSQAGGPGLPTVGAGDFDQDGAPDAVLAAGNHWRLNVFPGDGQGGLDDGPYDVLLELPGDVLVAELTGDGRPDAVTTAPNGDAVFLLPANDGRTRLALADNVTSAPSAGVSGIATADLDDDGHQDAVLCLSMVNKLGRALGDGTGDLGSVTSVVTGDSPLDVALADLDADGDLDAVVALNDADAVAVHLGNGFGGFVAATTYAGPDVCNAVRLGDFDGNGTVDVLAGAFLAPEMRLFPGAGNGTLLAASVIPLADAANLATGDLNGDFAPDVVLAYRYIETVEARINDGSGAFSSSASARVGYWADLPVMADVDGDGAQDVLVTTGSSAFQVGSVAFLQGDGAGGLQPPQYVPVPYLLSLGAGDLNGDGRPEAFGTNIEVFVDTFPATSYDVVHVFEADEDGGLQPGSFLADESGREGFAPVDLDEDGRQDLLMIDGTFVVMAALNLSLPHPWHDLGHALAGEHGEPSLLAVSWAEPGTPGVLRLSGAQPLAAAVLFVSPVSTPAAFKGGLLVPVPPVLASPLVTSVSGEVELAWSAWPALGPGSTYFLHAAVADAGAPAGVALSNALQLVQP